MVNKLLPLQCFHFQQKGKKKKGRFLGRILKKKKIRPSPNYFLLLPLFSAIPLCSSVMLTSQDINYQLKCLLSSTRRWALFCSFFFFTAGTHLFRGMLDRSLINTELNYG